MLEMILFLSTCVITIWAPGRHLYTALWFPMETSSFLRLTGCHWVKITELFAWYKTWVCWIDFFCVGSTQRLQISESLRKWIKASHLIVVCIVSNIQKGLSIKRPKKPKKHTQRKKKKLYFLNWGMIDM